MTLRRSRAQEPARGMLCGRALAETLRAADHLAERLQFNTRDSWVPPTDNSIQTTPIRRAYTTAHFYLAPFFVLKLTTH